jgi:hypothetical protein
VAPTLITNYFVESNHNGDTSTLTTPSFTPSNGEVVVVMASTWDTATTSGTPSGGSQTYTSQVTEAGGGFSTYVRIFTATISGSPGSMTIVLSAPSASSYHHMCVARYSGAQLAVTPATNAAIYSSASAPSSTITTTGTNSVVAWCCGDAQSVDPTGHTYRSSATELGLGNGFPQVSGVFYFAHQTAAASGSQTYGLTAPSTAKWSMVAIEVQAAATTGAAVPFRRSPSFGLITRGARRG